MFSLFNLFQRFGHYILFFVLEGLALYLIVNYNQSQKQIFIHSASKLTGSIMEKTSKIDEYVYLRDENQKLIRENTRLLTEIINLPTGDKSNSVIDSSEWPYEVLPAKVINQKTQSLRNYITLNIGSIHGVDRPMGIINSAGVVGIIKNIGQKYTSAMSLLHIDCRVSASLKYENYFGTITWKGRDITSLSLDGIPKYASISVGDSIVTNGYSTIFPEGILVGTVSSFELDRSGDFYKIEVLPAVDFGKLSSVYVIKNKDAEERLEVENEVQ